MPDLPPKYHRKTEVLPYRNKPKKCDGERSVVSDEDAEALDTLIDSNHSAAKEENLMHNNAITTPFKEVIAYDIE